MGRGGGGVVVGIGPNRLTSAPVALKVHAALVLLAAVLVWDRHRPGGWVGVVLVAITLWPLLAGSRLMWWVQAVALVIALGSAYETHGRISGPGTDLTPFVDPRMLGLVSVLLLGAAALLLLPSVRRYSDRGRGSVVLAVICIAWLPALGLAVEKRLPSSYSLEQVAGGTLLGSDESTGVAYYATSRGAKTCVVALATHMHREDCAAGKATTRRAEGGAR